MSTLTISIIGKEVRCYTKRPLKVNAIQYTEENHLAIKNWLTPLNYDVIQGQLYLINDDGHHLVTESDWVICDEGQYSVWPNKKFHIHFKLMYAGYSGGNYDKRKLNDPAEDLVAESEDD